MLFWFLFCDDIPGYVKFCDDNLCDDILISLWWYCGDVVIQPPEPQNNGYSYFERMYHLQISHEPTVVHVPQIENLCTELLSYLGYTVYKTEGLGYIWSHTSQACLSK